MVTFTIITCTYNASAFIERTLRSVQEQSYPHIEHIIQDGGSTDGTLDYCKSAPEGLLKVYSEKDGGLYDAMNKAIGHATGDYLVFLNAGDVLHSPTTLEDMAKQIDEASMPAVIYGDTDVVDEEGNYLGPRHLSAPEVLTWKSFKNGMLVCHQAFYVNTSVARCVKYDLQFRISADVDWCIRVMKEAEKLDMKLHNTHLILCNYLAGGMSIKNHRKSLMERFRIMCRHYGIATTVLKHISFLFRKKK